MTGPAKRHSAKNHSSDSLHKRTAASQIAGLNGLEKKGIGQQRDKQN
jgi:hypothetical protein